MHQVSRSTRYSVKITHWGSIVLNNILYDFEVHQVSRSIRYRVKIADRG